MASIMIVASGMFGSLLSWVELAKRLRDAGHYVEIAAPETGRPVVAAANMTFHVRPEPDLGFFTPRAEPAIAGLMDRIPGGREQRLSDAIETFETDSFLKLLDRRRPDLVLIDGELHPEIIVSQGRGHRVALLSSQMPSMFGPQTPPLSTQNVPGSGVMGSVPGVALTWAGYWGWKAQSYITTALKYWGGDYGSALRAFARDGGFDMRLMDRKRWQLPWGYRLPTLVPYAAELDLPGQRPDYIRYIGPLIATERVSDPRAAKAQAFLNAVQAEKEAGPTQLIYAGLGSAVAPESNLVTQLLAVLEARRDWRLLLVTQLDGALPSTVPANVCWVDWADQIAAMKMADLSISHGGINTISESIAYGVPSLVFPLRDLDQKGNAARVAFHQLGAIGDPWARATELKTLMEHTMDDVGIRAALTVTQQSSEAYRVEGIAEDTVASLLDGRLSA